MLQGDIYTFPLNDLMQWLAFTRRTGLLRLGSEFAAVQVTPTKRINATVSSEEHYLEFFFVEGKLAGAARTLHGTATSGSQLRAVIANALSQRRGRFTFSIGKEPLWARLATQRFSVEAILDAAHSLRESQQTFHPADLFDSFATDSRDGEAMTLAENLRLYAVSRILQKDYKIAALPDLTARVLELTSDENFSLRVLADLVVKDQAVTAQVMRFANSPIFGYSYKVETVEQAVKLLGADEVVNIVLASAIHSQQQKFDRYADQKMLIWKHSSAAAFIAHSIATKLELKCGLAFMCSLLMDLGTTVLYSLFQDLIERKGLTRDLPANVVDSIVWEYHPRIGRAVGEQWRLPKIVIDAMGYHHSIEENYHALPFVAVTALADFLATLVIYTPKVDLRPALERVSPALLIKHPAGKNLGLRASHAQQVLAELPICLHKSREFILS